MSTFTALDRCDRCGPSGRLLFCAHHLREHGPALNSRGAIVHDETDTLTTPSPGLTPTP